MAVGPRTVLPLSMVAVAGGQVSSSTTWMRDAFIRGTRNGTPGYMKCLASKSGNDQARWLAAADGTPVVCVQDVLLEGGDSLVGVDFRLVGHDRGQADERHRRISV